MATREGPPELIQVPNVPVNFVPATEGETFKLGTMTIRIMEDGSRTDNRLGAAELIIPPHTSGPPAHWHEMHDETFLTTKGTVRFHSPGAPDVDAALGDYVTVPVRSPHTFSNPFDEEARFFNTFSPAYYVYYFKLLSHLAETEGKGVLTPEVNKKAMSVYATFAVPKGEQ